LNRKQIAIIAAGVIVVAIILAALAAFNAGPQVPKVKFISFSPEGRQTIKDGQEIVITFKVKNYENYDVDDARVVTSLKGDPKFFLIDSAYFTIKPPIAGPNGESADLTVHIRGTNLGNQQAIEDKITVALYVSTNTEPSDKREIEIRLEK
jgi:hypothetical protein